MDRTRPLTTACFSILLALIRGEKHGYAIMQEINDSGHGRRIGPGTLYRSIRQLCDAGLVEESDERADPALDDQRRRYYRLTELGRRALNAEAQRLAGLVREAAKVGLIPRGLAT